MGTRTWSGYVAGGVSLGRVRRLALIAPAVLLLALVASQFALPPLAERDLRSELAATGDVREVEVRAFPALTLLADRADEVRVRIGAARSGTGELGDLLDSTRRTDRLDARADSLALGPLALRDLRLTKSGKRLQGRARLAGAALPDALGFRPVPSEDGQLVLEGTGGLLGGVRARLSARDGALVVAPDGLLGGLASLTVFSDPRIEMTSVGARQGADGYTITASGRLRDSAR